MDRNSFALGAATLALLLAGVGASLPCGKDKAAGPGIAPDKVADYLHSVLEADRTIYTTHVVERMQQKGIVRAAEHWEQDNALPLPAQFLQHSGRVVAEKGRGIRYRLISAAPIYQRNAPATDFERKALETLRSHAEGPVTGIVSSGKKQYFQAIYPDRAVSTACITCHNSHPLSPKRDFKVNDVMGGIAITIPLE